MNITDNLVIREYDNPLYPRRPYVLWIADYGPVGDKFDVDSADTPGMFPAKAAENMETLKEALEVREKFLSYVKSKITQAKKINQAKKIKSGKASYRLWR